MKDSLFADGSVTYGRDTVSAQRLMERSLELASILRANARCSVVGVRIPNEPALLVALQACRLAAKAFVPLDPSWTNAEAARAASALAVDLVLETTPTTHEPRESLLLSQDGRVLDYKGGSAALQADQADDIAIVHWSSGTTGAPKPIAISPRALEFRIQAHVKAFGLRPDDRVLCFVPMTHCHGLDCIALPALRSGASLVLMNPRSATPGNVLQEIDRNGVTVFSALPRFYAALLATSASRDALRTVRLPLCGSAALDPIVAAGFFDRFGVRICNGYGLTEVGIVTLNRHDRGSVRLDSVGPVLDGIQWRIARPDPNGVGELEVRSPGCASGYLTTSEAPRERPFGEWLSTADLVQAEPDGLLRIVGRTSVFINVDGAKVDPREVEETISLLAEVEECAVLGGPARSGGDAVHAFVVLNDSSAAPTIADGVRSVVASSLSPHKVPERVIVVDALPRTSLGKVSYEELRIPLELDSCPPSTPPTTSIETQLTEVWSEVLGRSDVCVGIDERFMEAGGTSVHLAQLRTRIEELFNRRLTIAELFEFPTIRAQAELLREQGADGPGSQARRGACDPSHHFRGSKQ
jgi:acyl-CoA synthetase (AMP-forming)/AMP-acid ligase II